MLITKSSAFVEAISHGIRIATRLTFLDTAVVLQNIVATPAATVITRCLYVKPFVVVLEVRRFRRHRRSFRLRFLRRPPL